MCLTYSDNTEKRCCNYRKGLKTFALVLGWITESATPFFVAQKQLIQNPKKTMSTLALTPELLSDSKDYVSPDMIEENTELLIEIVAASDYFDACTPPERSHLISYLFATQRAMFLRFAE